jgi:hypothetical protein
MAVTYGPPKQMRRIKTTVSLVKNQQDASKK